MEIFLNVLLILGVIVGIILVMLLIRFLFTSLIISRILSTGCSIASICMVAAVASAEASKTSEGGSLLGGLITLICAYMFFIGPIVFDVEWDGSFDITETFTSITVEPHMVGGFIGNLAAAAVGAFILYTVFADNLAVLIVVPVLMIIANLVTVIVIIKNRI